MTDQPNYLQDIFDIFVNTPEDTKAAGDQVIALGGIHLDVAVSFGGMLLMIMAANGYNTPQQVWDTVAQYEDLRNS